MLLYIGYFALGDLASNLWKNAYESKVNTVLNLVICVVSWLLVWFLIPLQEYSVLFVIPIALIGIAGAIALSLALKRSKLLQYLGKITLVILCIHGPIYRVLLKVLSVSVGMDTALLRKNFLMSLCVTAAVCVVCAIAYQVLEKITPWMIGHSRSKS